MDQELLDAWHMRRALELAALGRGAVEPNPLVGCVIVRGAEVIGEGYHHRYGGPHAEVEALSLVGERARGSTLYVTLEPCCHWGKTPPCTQAILAAGVSRVVAAMSDPFPQVDGGGLNALRQAGVEVTLGVLEAEARALNAPYLMLVQQGRPWVTAKWAMTLDGKLSARDGSSRWISGEPARQVVHELRGRMDAILVGAATARLDDPLLTARPPGPRSATRIVVDRQASLPLDSQLVRTARETPVLVAASQGAPAERIDALRAAGCEVWLTPDEAPLPALLAELGRRRMTHLLVEGGGGMLGAFFDADLIDELHVFIAPKLIGGSGAVTPLAGLGLAPMEAARRLVDPVVTPIGDDLWIHGGLRHDA